MEQLTENQINHLKALAKQTIEMRADVRVVIKTFKDAMAAFGLNDVTAEQGNIQNMLPEIVRRLTIKMASGSFDTQALANIQEVLPIFEKYKYLAENE